MKPSLLLRMIHGLLLVILLLIVLHAPLIVWVGSQFPAWAIAIKAWKEVLMGVVALLLVIEITRMKRWHALWSDRIIQLVAAFGVLHVVLLAFQFQGWNAAIAGLLIDLRYVLYFVEVYVALKLSSQLSEYYVRVAFIGALIVVGFAGLQLLLPHDFLASFGYGPDTIKPYITIDKNTDFIRQNSTLRGPNPLSAYASVVLLIALAFWYKKRRELSKKQRTILAITSLLAFVALTVGYSRSAWLGCLIGVAVFGLVLLRNRLSTKTWIAGFAVAGLCIGGLFMLRNNDFVSNVVFHDNPNGSAKKSDEGHLSSLAHGSQKALAQPLGGGIGSTGSASLLGDKPNIIENQYLFILHESGWLGFSLFAGLCFEIMRRLFIRRQEWLPFGVFLSGISLFFIGLLLPVFADDTVSIVWWGLAAVALAGVKSSQYGRTHASDKKATSAP